MPTVSITSLCYDLPRKLGGPILVLLAVALMLTSASTWAHGLDVRTLSTPADRVSGGDVLVEISNVKAHGKHPFTVKLNGHNVTPAFYPGAAPGQYIGFVTGLAIGKNVLVVGGKGYPKRTLHITNYPLSGPITSGPHITPFICQTHSFLLPDGTPYTDQPIDDPTCAAPTNVTYLYMPVGGTALQPLPPSGPLPGDIANTTTTTGATVRFIVRVETSTINRGIYQSAVLHDPELDPEPSPWNPPAGWNGRLIAIEGFGCPGGWYIQGASIGNLAFAGMDFHLLSPTRLGEGYATFSNTLQHASNNCNAVLAGEAAMMSKEHFVETFGAPRYTVTAGCSGGSYGSIQPADALPGLFDGALIACTFPDPLSIALSGSDGHLLANYFTVTNPGALTNAQQVAISGYKFSGADGLLAFIDAARQSGRTDPVPGRVSASIPGYVSAPFNPAVPEAERYDPVMNPGGARGTVYDASRNVYGVDPATGFALRPFDNIGVQYGLLALNEGIISPAQFLNLNQYIGGFDEDANIVAGRSKGSPGAVRRAYQSGLQFVGSGGLAKIPVVDITGIYNDDSGYHYQWFHFAARERMEQANGGTGNHVMWRGTVPFADAWNMFIDWVEAVSDDRHHGAAYDRVVRNKPANAVDGCWTSPTEFIAEPQTFSREPDSSCNALFPSYAFPRYVAGGPLAANKLSCRLKHVRRSDYPVYFTDDEFDRLKAIFAEGVCDWSKKGENQKQVVPWASFGPAPENLVFDVTGEPEPSKGKRHRSKGWSHWKKH